MFKLDGYLKTFSWLFRDLSGNSIGAVTEESFKGLEELEVLCVSLGYLFGSIVHMIQGIYQAVAL